MARQELAEALALGGRLRAGPDGLELAPGTDLPIPDSLRDAVLLPGDQVVFDAQHRFVVEAPARQLRPEKAVEIDLASTRLGERAKSPARRLPWLLLAALLIAGALSLLLLFGVG